MNYNSFRRILKNRFALSTVVTTLIILVISVLLAGVVTYYAINVVSTRVQEESLTLEDAHIWLNPTETTTTATDYSQASLMVINTGGRDVVINKIAVRGQDSNWASSSQFVIYAVTDSPVSTDMYFQPGTNIQTQGGGGSTTMGTLYLQGGTTGTPYTFNYASTDLVLKSGYTMLIYIVNPDSITINDIGLTVSITLYTAQAMYYQECNVQAYSATASGNSQGLSVSNLHAWYDSSGPTSEVAMVLTNNGGTAAAINSIEVNNVDNSAANFYSCAGTTSLTYIPALTDGYVYGSYALQLASGVSQLDLIDTQASMILYIQNPSGVGSSNLGQSIEVDITFVGGGSVSGTAVVQAAGG